MLNVTHSDLLGEGGHGEESLVLATLVALRGPGDIPRPMHCERSDAWLFLWEPCDPYGAFPCHREPGSPL